MRMTGLTLLSRLKCTASQTAVLAVNEHHNTIYKGSILRLRVEGGDREESEEEFDDASRPSSDEFDEFVRPSTS